MWTLHPKLMCRKHLIGQHVEMHMFLGSIKKGTSMKGFIEKNLFEPKVLKKLHDETAEEMIRRGYNHKSPITEEEFTICFSMLSEEYQNHSLNSYLSMIDLIERCPECKENSKMSKNRLQALNYFVNERN